MQLSVNLPAWSSVRAEILKHYPTRSDPNRRMNRNRQKCDAFTHYLGLRSN